MEQNDKYEERIRQRAEEMAKVHHDARTKQYNLTGIVRRKEWDNLHADHRAMMTREFMPAGRVAVQWEAEAIKMGMVAAIFWGLNESNIADKLVHDGYIPSPNQQKQ